MLPNLVQMESNAKKKKKKETYQIPSRATTPQRQNNGKGLYLGNPYEITASDLSEVPDEAQLKNIKQP